MKCVLCVTQNFVVKVTLVWNPGPWIMTYGEAYCVDLQLFRKCTSRYRGADKFLARPGRKQANVFCQNGVEFLRRLALHGGKKTPMTARVSMLLKSRASLACFRACFFFLVGLRTYQHPGYIYIFQPRLIWDVGSYV